MNHYCLELKGEDTRTNAKIAAVCKATTSRQSEISGLGGTNNYQMRLVIEMDRRWLGLGRCVDKADGQLGESGNTPRPIR